MKVQSGGFKIFPQVLLTMFLVALVPLAGFWLVNNVRVQREMRANAEQNLRDASSTLAAGVDGWVDANVRALRQNASLPDVASMQLERQAPVLATMPATYDWMYSAFVINGDGFISARGDDEPILNEDGSYLEDRGDREYYLEAVEGNAAGGNTVGEQTIISSRTGEPAMCMSSPIRREQNVVGVLATCSFLDSIAEAVVNTRIGETGFAVLVDDKNNVIAHGDLNLNELELEDPLNLGDYPALADGQLGQQTRFEQDGREVVAYTQETALGWKLVVQQDYADAFASVLAARRNALLLLAATVVLVVVVASLMARRLVGPIQSLTKAADDMSRGQLEVNIRETARGDEIGALARSVERMGVSIKMAFEELGTSKA